MRYLKKHDATSVGGRVSESLLMKGSPAEYEE